MPVVGHLPLVHNATKTRWNYALHTSRCVITKISIRLPRAVLLAVVVGCSSDDPTGPAVKDFVYPLKIGNKWQYSREVGLFNFRPDTAGVVPPDTARVLSTSTVEILRTETLHDTIETSVFQERLVEGSFTFQSQSYFNNRADGLYFYAYRGVGYVIPLSRRASSISFKGRDFGSVSEVISFIEGSIGIPEVGNDSLLFEDPPLRSLAYPFVIGLQWVYREPGKPWRIDKRILGIETVRVPAGAFACYKIQWLMDISNDGDWDDEIEFFDYISREGLVRRSLLVKDLVVTGPQGPEPIGKVDLREESKLTDVHLE